MKGGSGGGTYTHVLSRTKGDPRGIVWVTMLNIPRTKRNDKSTMLACGALIPVGLLSALGSPNTVD